ncbi:hypothetical protein QAD02_017501 [Eretmocerus hayati]|uniref:Uncharacterized protein n=2 Tax=Eretmocerus hayati TaxID=131215 RepID=A0ACC2PEG4_9HYME|nr:hypothetical protein QAD02_017496 [Eretmocerus hayati]KAJ8681709.1 hypothetical protein QAD02_017501 [Eretmocerus hayati]
MELKHSNAERISFCSGFEVSSSMDVDTIPIKFLISLPLRFFLPIPCFISSSILDSPFELLFAERQLNTGISLTETGPVNTDISWQAIAIDTSWWLKSSDRVKATQL